MKAELRTITPEIAARMLDANTSNRPITEANIARLTKEIKNGKWKVNGDMIRLSDSNTIIDGQHRLYAVMRSKITIQSWVMTGLPSDVFDTIDLGKRRTSGDTLACRGEQNACRMGAALIMIDKYMTGQVERTVTYSNTEIEGLLLKYPDIRKSIMTSHNGKKLVLPSVLDSCHYLFSKKSTVMTQEFMDKVFKGIGLEVGNPFYALREKLINNSNASAKISKAFEMALCIKAWNAARSGQSIKYLKLDILDGKMKIFPVVL